MYINQGQEGLAKFFSISTEIFKESDQIHACPADATLQQREKWTHRPHHAVVTEMMEGYLEDAESWMLTIIYSEESGDDLGTQF